MFLFLSLICGIATTLYLARAVRAECVQMSIIERMNKARDEKDPALFCGNSRLPNE